MSQFLPEGFKKEDSKPFLNPAGSEAGNLSPEERELWQRLSGTPADISPDFKKWLENYVLVNIVPQIPVFQLQGFGQFSASSGAVAASESTGSLTYTNLATTGPELTGLSDGQYVVIWGCGFVNSGNSCYMGISFNGAAVAGSDEIGLGATTASGHTLAYGITKTLSNADNNSITAKYKVNGGTGSFQNRWLLALKVGN